MRMLLCIQERLQLLIPVTQLASAVLEDFSQSSMSLRGQGMQRFWAARLDGALERCTESNLILCLSHRPRMMRNAIGEYQNMHAESL